MESNISGNQSSKKVANVGDILLVNRRGHLEVCMFTTPTHAEMIGFRVAFGNAVFFDFHKSQEALSRGKKIDAKPLTICKVKKGNEQAVKALADIMAAVGKPLQDVYTIHSVKWGKPHLIRQMPIMAKVA